MLDKFSKSVLKQFVKRDINYTNITLCHYLKIDDSDKVDKSLNILLELDLIKIKSKDLNCIIYCLTNKGRNYFKTLNNENFNKYWFPIITSTISYILGIITNLLLK